MAGAVVNSFSGMGKRRSEPTAENKEEARKLKAIYDGARFQLKNRGITTQAAFGHEFDIGDQGAVSTFLLGNTPLSLKAALGFARGLGCDVSDFSPRLSRLIKRDEPAAWPLDPFISRERWESLSEPQRAAVAWEAKKALDAIEAAAQPDVASGKRHGRGAP